eukprot:COSAG01_NODE_1071_length_11863_cov_36.887623_2_plen_63_part_00
MSCPPAVTTTYIVVCCAPATGVGSWSVQGGPMVGEAGVWDEAVWLSVVAVGRGASGPARDCL